MKKVLRHYLFIVVSIYFLAYFIPGLSYSNNFVILLFSSAVFWAVSVIGKPMIKLAMLPINLLTLGLFSWATNLIVLFVTTKLVEGFYVTGFSYGSLSWGEINITAGEISTFWSALIIAVLLSGSINILQWIGDD